MKNVCEALLGIDINLIMSFKAINSLLNSLRCPICKAPIDIMYNMRNYGCAWNEKFSFI
jgi:hypothetical protein